jgi:nucleoside-diphosphate-sugar epimerase
MLNKLMRGENISLNEDGKQRRDFVHVDDVVAANLQAMDLNSDGCSIINLGTGVETSLLEFSNYAQQAIREVLHREPGKIELSNKLQEGDVRHCKIDCSNARDYLGFKPTTTLRQGLFEWVSRSLSLPTDRCQA